MRSRFADIAGWARRAVGVGVLLAFGPTGLWGQSVPSHAGRPFVVVSRANASDPIAGFISGFGRAQVVGDAVVFATMSGASAGGVFRGRGGPLARVAGVGTATSAGPLQFFHDGFARDTTVGSSLVLAAGTSRADALWLTDGTEFAPRLSSGVVLPNSGGKPANVLGEPFLVGDALAVIAAHRPTGGADDFRGVYRVKSGALEAVADTATALPGLGVPDGFSSQVGFDGVTVAFWASQGPFTEHEGIFVQVDGGAVRLVAREGDAFPGGGTMAGFLSPPFVAEGVVYFHAFDADRATRLMRYADGVLTVLARDGGTTAENDVLQSLGQFGLAVEAGQVFFPALTSRGPGLYAHDGTGARTILAPGMNNLGGLRPASMVLQDVAGDTVVLEVSDSSQNRRLVANLGQPAVPVIVNSPTNLTVASGSRVELRVTALGDAPLAYVWQWSSPTGVVNRATTDTLVIEAAGAGDVGYYSVRVTNVFGVASTGSFFLNVEAAPRVVSEPTSVTLEAGDPLSLRVIALGGQPLGYEWRRDELPVTSDSLVAGMFVRTAASSADSGRYRVTVSNAWGQVTSAEVVVTVNPAAPNPVFGGGRFASVLSGSTLVPGGGLGFDLQPITEGSFRVLDGRLLFAGGPSGSPRAGIFAWDQGTLTRVLGAGMALPHGLGEAEGFMLMDSAVGEPLAVVGYQLLNGFAQPVGLYRVQEGGLEVVADTSMAAPGFGEAKFPVFFYGAVQAGGQVVFGTRIGTESVLYRADAGGLSRVVASTRDLPVVGTGSIQFHGLGFDGGTVSFVAGTAGLQKQVALRLTAGGELTALLAKGDPIPGTTDTVNSLGSTVVDGGAVYLVVFGSSFARSVVEWRDGGLRRIAAPGMAVSGGGTVQVIETSTLIVDGGRVLLAGSLNLPEGVRRAVFAASSSGIEPVLVTTKLDARPVGSLFVAGGGGGRVVVGTIPSAGDRAFYANVGALDDAPLVLRYGRTSPGGLLQLTVPAGAVLEAVGGLNEGQPWQPLPGVGDIPVNLEGARRFFRLRRE